MGFSDSEGKPGSFAEQYSQRRESHLTSLQQKEEEMRQKFVIRVKEKESELKDAEREVKIFFLMESFVPRFFGTMLSLLLGTTLFLNHFTDKSLL